MAPKPHTPVANGRMTEHELIAMMQSNMADGSGAPTPLSPLILCYMPYGSDFTTPRTPAHINDVSSCDTASSLLWSRSNPRVLQQQSSLFWFTARKESLFLDDKKPCCSQKRRDKISIPRRGQLSSAAGASSNQEILLNTRRNPIHLESFTNFVIKLYHRTHVGIVPDDAAGRRIFSGISRFPRTFIPALLHNNFVSPSSSLKTTMFRAAQISQLPCERELLNTERTFDYGRITSQESRLRTFENNKIGASNRDCLPFHVTGRDFIIMQLWHFPQMALVKWKKILTGIWDRANHCTASTTMDTPQVAHGDPPKTHWSPEFQNVYVSYPGRATESITPLSRRAIIHPAWALNLQNFAMDRRQDPHSLLACKRDFRGDMRMGAKKIPTAITLAFDGARPPCRGHSEVGGGTPATSRRGQKKGPAQTSAWHNTHTCTLSLAVGEGRGENDPDLAPLAVTRGRVTPPPQKKHVVLRRHVVNTPRALAARRALVPSM
ncbi:hypothetical protein PR048_019368 [Dryococelus australis]|uniref:Uncharacterized protein n=1 Tax=Dryococelus australis TaxID=614101 RepID=A0ABQ9H3D8_9NEOP|nr:hypothetical protein PR048_019368 [Dryococelus australis]